MPLVTFLSVSVSCAICAILLTISVTVVKVKVTKVDGPLARSPSVGELDPDMLDYTKVVVKSVSD